MTTQFYVPPDDVRDGRVVLPAEEARHAARALRKEVGDLVWVVDGAGTRYRVRLDHVSPEQVVGAVVDGEEDAGEPPYRLTLGLGLLKNRNRYETFLEKAVELGVRQIVPLISDRTEAESLRRERSQNILIAAMKQCGRSYCPDLTSPTHLADVLAPPQEQTVADLPPPDAHRFLCHEATDGPMLHRAVREAGCPRDVLVLVGPEGGFSDEEVQVASDLGVVPVRLGPHRLRAETAAITACAALSMTYAEP